MTGIHRQRPGGDAIAAAHGEPALSVGDGIWLSPGLSNSYMITSDEGRIVVNAGMGFEGPLHRRVYDAVDSSPTRALIFTQGHYDHVGGVESVRDEGTDVIAQANWKTWRDDNERLQSFRARNAAFAWSDKVIAAMAHAKELGVHNAPQGQPEPTTTFVDRLDLSIGGRHLVLLAVPGGETTDALVIWLPETRTLFTGNLFGPLFGHVPNLVTIRGDRYRDALTYIVSLDLVLGLGAERLLTGHFEPIDGAGLIAEEITAMRDSTQWTHDRTVEGMEAGSDIHTLMRDIRLPSQYDIGEGYGKVSWNVRAIWENYAGWFHHRSTTELYDVPPNAVAPDIVAAAGADSLVDAAAARVAAGQPVAALHLTDLVLAADAAHQGARRIAGDAHRALLAGSHNFWETAWLARAADELGSTT